MIDGLQEILYTLKQNKLRTALTAFGVFWGIFMLIFLLGAGRGMQNGVIDSFADNALDTIIIWSGTTSVAHNGQGLGRRVSYTDDDIEAIRHHIDGVRFVTGANSMGQGTVVYGSKTGFFDVYGIDDTYFKIRDQVPIRAGRTIQILDQEQTRKVAVIGSAVRDRLFGHDGNPIGAMIRVNNINLTVVGVFHDRNNNGRDSERLFVPYSTFTKTFGRGNQVHVIWARPDANVDGKVLEENIIELLKKRHNVSPDDRRAIQSFNFAEPAKMVKGMFVAINALIWFVGLGTLTAGIVGISNIMIITVKERTREIGIRKALGATPFSIVSTLLMESILVTGFAGYMGLVVGVGIVELMAYGLEVSGAKMDFFQRPEVDFQVAVTALVLLVVVGTLAGLIPAIRAAKIAPVEAMRSDG
ncbi:ABC transporter permease [Gilvimarinus sp. SDUM040013]|uniref:ABC transporter permease n=1 Tax=Gilvimarinus gilvus TaxID=3058038 RepID=A0ABU4RZA0_9GAMM|nr:ABC transporter permease [Gilvimarinus sp. SDUM040013]MDO3388647.1 ABC transporter permease [Gilvimarinus sp. SDUM040013]MDX6849542.1 ABC transporter permease [Gilvimarinus sp. SDUM040013]